MMMASAEDEYVKQWYASGNFDPRVYVQTFFPGPKVEDEEKFFLDAYHYMFSKKVVKGDEMLDLGTGPMMTSMISASAYIQKITLSDYLESNCEELRMWLRKDPKAISFKYLYEYVAQIEDSDTSVLEQRVRSKVINVIRCDVTLPKPLAPLNAQYDVILSSLCLEGAVTTKEQYAAALVNISRLVKPKGYLLFAGSFGCKEYTMGAHTVPTVNLTQEIIEQALEAAGFKPVFWMILPRDLGSSQKPADFTSCYVFAAQKM